MYSLTRILAAGIGLVLALAGSAIAQTAEVPKGTPEQEAAGKQGAIFVELVKGPWGLVTANWTGEPKDEEFAGAEKTCLEQKVIEIPKPLGNAQPDMPPPPAMFGTIVFYPGQDGLQKIDLRNGEIILYKDIKVGQMANGAPVYQIEGDQGATNVFVARVQGPKKPLVGMLVAQELYISCRQDF